MPTPGSLQFDGRLANVAVQYRNELMLADDVLPRSTVPKQTGVFKKYAKDERFSQVNTIVGDKSEPNEVEWTPEEDTFTTKDYGLQEFVSDAEVANAEAPFSAESDAAEFVTDLVMLDREIRVEAFVTATGNYNSANRSDKVGAKWSTFTNPALAHIEEAIDGCFAPPTIMVMGLDAWRALTHNEDLLAAIKGVNEPQFVTEQAVAAHFGLAKVLVGRTRINTARKGQTATYGRIWSLDVCLLRVKSNPGLRDIVFGTTFQWGSKVALRARSTRGLRGGTMIRIGESVVEKSIAKDAGFLLQNVI